MFIYYGLFSGRGKKEPAGKQEDNQLYLDQQILKEVQNIRKNVAMAWIGSKTVYDVVPQTWMIESPKIYKISDKIINLIMNMMENWRMELAAGG